MTKDHLLICSSCGVAHIPEDMKSHLKKQHTEAYKRVKEDLSAWNEAISQCGIANILPKPPSNIPPPLYGLPVEVGLKCSDCNRCAPSRDSLRHHKCTGNTSEKTFMQRFNHNTASKWFPVQLPRDLDDHTDSQFQTLISNFLQPLSVERLVDDPRMVSPWLLTTKWNKYVENIDIDTIHAAVSTEGYLALRDWVLKYLRRAEGKIEATNCIVLQKLNTNDPAWYETIIIYGQKHLCSSNYYY